MVHDVVRYITYLADKMDKLAKVESMLQHMQTVKNEHEHVKSGGPYFNLFGTFFLMICLLVDPDSDADFVNVDLTSLHLRRWFKNSFDVVCYELP